MTGRNGRARVFDVVIFVFDGVLADTRGPQIKAWQTICEGLNIPMPDDRWIRHLMGYGDAHVASVICEPFRAFTPELERRMIEDKRGMCKGQPVVQKEGVAEALRMLDDQGIITAVVTPRQGDSVNMLLQDWGFDKLLTYLLGSNYVGPEAGVSPVPDPDPFIAAMQMLGVRPHACVIVEDNLPGLTAANQSGGFPVGLAGTLTPQELEICTEHIVDDFRGIVELLTLFESRGLI